MYRLPLAALWILVFSAVLGHLPGLGFDYGSRDFLRLAVGAGLTEPSGFSARPWTDLWVWNLWWRAAGSDASIPQTVSILLVALNSVLIAMVAARLGTSRAGSVLAGALWLTGSVTGFAVASVSSGAELWTLFFGLAALRLWLGHAPRRDPPLAALLILFAIASGPASLFFAPLLWVAGRWFGPVDEAPAVTRGRVVLLALAGTVAVVAALLPAFTTGSGGFWFDPARAIEQLGVAAWPWPVGPGAGTARLVGSLVMVAAAAALWWTRRKPAPRLRFALLWTGLAWVAASFSSEGGALTIAAGLAWTVGVLVGPSFEDGLQRMRERFHPAGAVTLVLVLLILGPGWAALRTHALHLRAPDGGLANAVLEDAVISAGVRQQFNAVLATPTPPPQIAILQATRTPIPEDARIPEGREVLVASPVHRAVAGTVGPRLMVAGRATARWTTLLDGVDPDASVFLDAGDHWLRPLGPVENARIYAALIAVAAGQFDLARHELWVAIETQGSQVQFAFDSDHLPITEAELDAEAADFARTLQADGTPPALRVLKLFASVYESVRGQPLIEEGWGGPLRSGRVDR